MEPREIARCRLCFKTLFDNQRLVLDRGLTYCSLDCWRQAHQRLVRLHPGAKGARALGIGCALCLLLLLPLRASAASEKALRRMASTAAAREREAYRQAWQNNYWRWVTRRPPPPLRPPPSSSLPPLFYQSHDGYYRYDSGAWNAEDRPHPLPPRALRYGRHH